MIFAPVDNRKAVARGVGPDSGLQIVDLSAETGGASQENLPQSPAPAPAEF